MAGSLHDLWVAYLNRAPKDDYFIPASAARSALNDNLLAASGSAAIDTMYLGNNLGSAHSFNIQINASAGISAGAITLEGSNDNVNFTPMPWVDGATTSSATFSGAAITIAANTFRFFQGPLTYRYFRVRISTAFVGGTVTATCRLSTVAYSSGATTVKSNSAATLLASAVLTPQGSGGNSQATAALLATPVSVKASAGQVYSYDIHNPNASIAYVSLYDNAAPTVGTTTQKRVIGIPANVTKSFWNGNGLPFATAITMAATTTRGGTTAPGIALDVNIDYT